MKTILVAVRLEPGPRGKLPPWGGLIDTAEERGLLNLVVQPGGGLQQLPEGVLWGRFEDEPAALAALDAALADASDLLGYPLTARGRVACPVGAHEKNWREIPFDPAEALLYLSPQ